jgi:hypothetical protein
MQSDLRYILGVWLFPGRLIVRRSSTTLDGLPSTTLNGVALEFSKYTTLKCLDSLSWLERREGRTCQFDLPEILFDLYFLKR